MQDIDGRNRVMVIAESRARESYRRDFNHKRSMAVMSPLKTTAIGPHRRCVRCVAIRIVRFAYICVTLTRRGTAEWLARVDRVR